MSYWARDRFAADVENDIADLEAVIGGDPVRLDGRDHHAAVGLAGRRVRPSFGTTVGNLVFLLLVRRLLLIRQGAERQRHLLFLTVMDEAKLNRGAGVIVPILRASSRASRTAAPSTEVMTSPLAPKGPLKD
jgi:hypothetical protein